MKKVVWMLLLAAAGSIPAHADEDLVEKDGKWVRLAEPKEGTAAGELSLLRQDLDGKRYGDALKHAQRFLKRYPADPLREEVMGLAGDAELARGHYWQAYEWCEKQLAAFPGGEGMERALKREMEVAEAFLAGKKRIAARVFRLPARSEGIDILQRIAEHAPGTPTAEAALLTIGDYYYNQGQWADAVSAYDNYLKLFPRSRHAEHAELHAAQALRRSYRGAQYDETPLLEAEQRFGAFHERYPAAARQANVEQVLRQIRAARAEKQFEVGRFYARTGRKAAAAQYFNLVVDAYGDTDWAVRAEAELTRLGQPRSRPAPAASRPAETASKEPKP
jgi:outer membrane assembly lipoprotein YfiO